MSACRLRVPRRASGRAAAGVLACALLGVLTLGAGCATPRAASGPVREVEFEPVTVTADLELEKLNDVELYAEGTSAMAANDHTQAARYFGRLADFHRKSPHWAESVVKAGRAHQLLGHWDEAYTRFAQLADPARGHGHALEAAFRMAESLYHLERYTEAEAVLATLAWRADIGTERHLQALVERGVCQLEAGRLDEAETTLRRALDEHQALPNPDDLPPYVPAQAQFFLGEIFRLHYEQATLDTGLDTDQLAKALDFKAQLLLSAQGHYLRAIRKGDPHWATASGARIGGLYDSFYDQLLAAPAPRELNPAEAEVYREEVRRRIRVLLTKAIDAYEQTLDAAERIGAENTFVIDTRARLAKMKERLLRDAERDDPQS